VSHRLEQVNASIQRAVQQVLARGLNDPRVRGLITVTRVDVAPDLSRARVMVSILPEDRAELAMHGLQHAAQHIRTQIGKSIDIRRMPELDFRLDDSLKRAEAVYASIYKASHEHDESALDPPGDRGQNDDQDDDDQEGAATAAP
jgi:ribosome-binding factor A